jgi:class 3 adenylate cyclase/tetratricopeptide (TPR) repeat protein
MQCPRCRAENREGRRFCGECGLSFASTCPLCGFLNEGSEKFCGGCGRSLSAAPATAEAKFSSPQTYTPKHLAEKILTSKSALEGERKQVTVLFADLKGSMELLADRDPEEARKLLDPVLELMMEAVHRYEGTVNQVMGDGIMALFGAPLAHEDHAVRGCYAALRMQQSAKRHADEARRVQGVNMEIRVGLNSGEVVVRTIGSDLHMDYSAVGQTTNLAARMEQLASPGSILLTPLTMELAEGFVEGKSLGPVHVKGVADAMPVYELTGAGPARTRFQATARRGLTRFVGRDADLEQLHRAQQLAANGHGQIAAIVGEPGVGKSRLLFELTHSHRVEGWLVAEARAVSYGTGTSYLPVIDLLKGYFKIADHDTYRDIREKITGKVLTLDRALEPQLMPLLALLGIDGDERGWRELDSLSRRLKTLDALKRLFIREAQIQPMLLVFEDLHWIDSETQALLDSLVESLSAVRILLLVNYRPEYTHRWGNKSFYTQLRLDRLPAESALELLHNLLGDHATVAPLAPVLIDRTQGNPFFLEESVSALAETKVLVGERGGYRLGRPLSEIQMPPTVRAVLAARIDRLPPEDKRLLQSAAVIGKDVAFPLLATIADQSVEELGRRLANLRAAEFLYEVRLFPETEYTFKHALTHEVAYGALLQDRRRELHARVLTSIERIVGERRSEHVYELARHAFEAHSWEAAARYCREAAQRSRTRDGNREAVQLFERSLHALDQLPKSDVSLAPALDVLAELRTAYWRLNQARRALDISFRAEELARVLGDRRRLALSYATRISALCYFGEYDRAFENGRQAVQIAEDLGDMPLQAMAHYFAVWPHRGIGDYQTAVRHADQSLALFATLPLEVRNAPDLIFWHELSKMFSAWCRAETGEFAQGKIHGEDALREAEERQDRYVIATAGLHVGDIYHRKGDFAQAERLLRRSMEMIESADISQIFPYIAARLGLMRVILERSDEGIPLIQEAVRLAMDDSTWEMAPAMTMLGEGYFVRGRLEDAHHWLSRAREVALARRERGHEAWAVRLLGDIEAHPDRFNAESGEALYREALALAEPRGMRPLVAHCHLGLSKLYRRTGKREQAQEHLTTATSMYREMGMTYWLEKAEAER